MDANLHVNTKLLHNGFSEGKGVTIATDHQLESIHPRSYIFNSQSWRHQTLYLDVNKYAKQSHLNILLSCFIYRIDLKSY